MANSTNSVTGWAGVTNDWGADKEAFHDVPWAWATASFKA